MAVMNSNGPAEMPSSKNDFGTLSLDPPLNVLAAAGRDTRMPF
jgi:hypothetical protein